MAGKCGHCNWKIKENEESVFCTYCGAQYHAKCFSFKIKCEVCGNPTPLGLERQGIDTEKQRQEYERQRQEAERQRQEAERQRQEAERQRIDLEERHRKFLQEQYNARIEALRARGMTGYYEYKVISLVDQRGSVDINRLMNQLNELGLDGWRLQCAYTNEMGKDSLSIAGFGINSTADQNILILERFVRIV